jgi:hypothetical protein
MLGEIIGQFSPTKFHLSLLGSLASCGHGGTSRRKLERPKLVEGGDSELQNKHASCGVSDAYASGTGSEEEEEINRAQQGTINRQNKTLKKANKDAKSVCR